MSAKLSRRTILKGLGTSALLSGCATASPQKFDAETIVIGAGLSGLYAARLLAELGQDVLVLEADQRIGGRLHTLDFGEYGLADAGGQQIGAGYARMRSVARELNVQVLDDEQARSGTVLHYKNQLIEPADWPQAASNMLPEGLKSFTPSSVLTRLALKESPFATTGDWRSPGSADISAYDWLQKQNLPESVIADADLTLNANDLKSYSMANLFRSLALYKQDQSLGKSGYIKGGAQRLPEAMAKALPRSAELGRQVRKISVTDNEAFVTTSDKVYRAKQVIAAVPFSVLAKMQIKAPLTQLQRTAIKDLPYTQILQIHFRANTPYWEQDGHPPSMWTDGPLERIFAQSDIEGKSKSLQRAWINGTAATNLNELSDQAIAQFCSDELQRMRPASKGDIEVLKVVRWTPANPLAGGAYMHWAPGQIDKWAGVMGDSAGRLHFAGEHLSHLHTGMEGAMESGENTAFKVLDSAV